jgi:hypothetical protein
MQPRSIYVSKDEPAPSRGPPENGTHLSGAPPVSRYALPVPESAYERLESTPMVAGGPTLDQLLASAHGEESCTTSACDDALALRAELATAAARDLSQDFATDGATTVLRSEVRSL